MRKTYTIVALVAALAVAAGLLLKESFAQTASAPATAIVAKAAVCDVQDLFTNYKRAKDELATLADKRQAALAEDEKRGKAIDALQMELEGLKQGSKEYQARLSELQRLTIDRAVNKQVQETMLLSEHRRLTIELYNQIQQTIGKVAKEQGYNLVLYREQELVEARETEQVIEQIRTRKVIYSDPALDITKDVLSRLNESYRSESK
ncbi:MAG: OmpH family outer membrane protein [Phycisphaerae bacterium]|jgi:Skp family chaperone for outer membrane proteins